MKEIDFRKLKKKDLFSVIAKKGSVYDRNGERSYKEGVFEYVGCRDINPKTSVVFAKFLKYQVSIIGEISLCPYELWKGHEYNVEFQSDEWDLFEHKEQKREIS